MREARADDADDADAIAAEVEAMLGTGDIAAAALEEMKAKRAIGSRSQRVARLAQIWPELRRTLPRRLAGAGTMQERLRTLGAAAHPADLGLPLAALARDYRRARLIRRRYTLLDLLEDLGWLDRAVADLFATQGFWGRQKTASLSHARFTAHP